MIVNYYLLFLFVNISTSLAFVLDFLEPAISVKPESSGDAYLTTSQIIAKHGYRGENHYPVTRDGYILGIHRITGLNGSPGVNSSNPVILIMPGLCISDTPNVITGPGKSLGFGLSDAGFDVWMGNFRGGRYSSNHTSLNPSDLNFWNFDLWEQSMIDTPTIIDYILSHTNQRGLHFVGLSFSGIGINYLLGLKPEYNTKVRSLIYLSAAMSLKNSKSAVLQFGAHLVKPLAPILSHVTVPILAYSDISTTILYKGMQNPGLFLLAWKASELFLGPYGEAFDYEFRKKFSTYTASSANGCPAAIPMEASQMLFFDTFRLFDTGRESNIAKYGTPDPPVINMSLITPPKLVFYGTEDTLITATDVQWMVSTMNNVAKVVAMPGYSHAMITFANNYQKVVVDPIVYHVNRYNY